MTYNIKTKCLIRPEIYAFKEGSDLLLMANYDLKHAKKANNNEFYTQLADIEREILNYTVYNPDIFRNKTVLLPCDDPERSNFTRFFILNFKKFGLKKLISTGYAQDRENPDLKGKIFVLENDNNISVDTNNPNWEYLQGNGDFRSEEIKKFRDEADIIITNPPFNTLFREFWEWLNETDKKFLIIASINYITYNYVFPLIKNNSVWLGTGMGRKISGFIVPDEYALYGSEARIDGSGNRIVSTNDCLWLTNLDHGRRHQPLKLMTMSENLKFNNKLLNKLKKKYGYNNYPKYDNYDAIEVPYTDAIPDDYDGITGVPVTFLDKYCPEQFEIIGLGNGTDNFQPSKIYENPVMHAKNGKTKKSNAINRVLVFPVDKNINDTYYTADNSEKFLYAPYARILIKKRQVFVNKKDI